MLQLPVDQQAILLSEMETMKSGLDIQKAALVYRLSNLNLILGHYGLRRFKKLKFF